MEKYVIIVTKMYENEHIEYLKQIIIINSKPLENAVNVLRVFNENKTCKPSI